MKSKVLNFLCLLVIGFAVAHNSLAEQPKTNGKLIVDTLAPEDIRYTGKPYNAELGAYVFNARSYDPTINRWTTSDPSGFPDGANNHAFVANDPTSVFDADGMADQSIAWVYWVNDQGPGIPGLIQKKLTATLDAMNTANAANPGTYNAKGLNPNLIVVNGITTNAGVTQINTLLGQYSEIILFTHGEYGIYNPNTYMVGPSGAPSPQYPMVNPLTVFTKPWNIIYATCANGYSPIPLTGALGNQWLGSMCPAAMTTTENYLKE